MRPNAQRGLTAVEVAVGVALLGSVLAVAAPTFARELHASRFSEPVHGLERIGASAVAYAGERPADNAFPAPAPLTPAEVPRGVRAVDPAGTWDGPTWQALDFQTTPEGAPHCYSFGFDSATGHARSSFVAHAHGDLDGDGVTSVFEVRGHAVDGDPDGPTLEPGVYVHDELE